MFGKIEDYIKDNIKMIQNKDLEFIVGLMVKYIKEIGQMENRMDLENLLFQMDK